MPLPAQALDSSGTDFWIAFSPTVPPAGQEGPIQSLRITSDVDASGTITNASLGINIPFNFAAGTVADIALPDTVELVTNDTITDQSLHVTSNAPVTVVGISNRNGNPGGYLALPTSALGTDYVISTLGDGLGRGSTLAIVATEDATDVTVTPAETVGGKPAGIPYNLSLSQGDTYLLYPLLNEEHPDLTGTRVTANKPVAVYGGHTAARIPGDVNWADLLTEQLWPISEFGTQFPLLPFGGREGGDVVRIVAPTAGTQLAINGVTVVSLDANQYYQINLVSPTYLTASHPVAVTQYARGADADGLDGDPLMTLVSPTQRYLASQRVIVPELIDKPFTARLNVIVPTSATATVQVNGVPVPAMNFVTIGTSSYSGAQVPVQPGSHVVTAAAPMGVTVYGFGVNSGYGYPGAALVGELSADLQVQKTTTTPSVETSGPVSFTVTVTNAGPDDAVGATVTDLIPAQLLNASWTCAPAGGGTCTPNGVGNIADLVNLPAGASLTYTIDATAPANPAAIENTASVTAPDNIQDPVPGNNSDSALVDVTAPLLDVDVSVQKQAAASSAEAGTGVGYQIVVTNAGPDGVTGVEVTDVMPAELVGVTWQCTPSPGAACTPAGAGNIADLVDLPANASVTYQVAATAPATPGTVINTASATVPATALDAAAANNTDDAAIEVTEADGPPSQPPVPPVPAVIPALSLSSLIGLMLSFGLLGVLAIRRR